MKSLTQTLFVALALFVAPVAPAQVPVTPNPNHDQLLAGGDAKAVANKRLVYDFWREVFEGGHVELADKYMAEDYIQHNPTVATGRAAFIDFLGKFSKPKAIEPRVKAPLVQIVAEGDFVILVFAQERKDPKNKEKNYTTTWFDMFRIKDGKMAEHWDPAVKR